MNNVVFLIKSLLKEDIKFYEKYIFKISTPNRAFILHINNIKFLYTIPKITPNKEGRFIIHYYRENLKSPLISLNDSIVNYILVIFPDYKYFYLIPLGALPLRDDLSIKTGGRVYPNFLTYNKPHKDILP